MSRVAEKYIALAKEVSKKSKCMRRRFGAVATAHSKMALTGHNVTPYNIECEQCARRDVKAGHDYSMCPALHAEISVLYELSIRKYKGPIKIYVYGEDVASGREIVAVNPCADCAHALQKHSNITVIGHNEYGEAVEWDRKSTYKEVVYVERG